MGRIVASAWLSWWHEVVAVGGHNGNKGRGFGPAGVTRQTAFSNQVPDSLYEWGVPGQFTIAPAAPAA